MTENKSNNEVKKLVLPSKPQVIENYKWQEKDEFIVLSIDSFEKRINSYNEMKHIIRARLVNPNNNKELGPELYEFQSNSETVKKEFNDYFGEWNENMNGTRVAAMMSSSTTIGLYLVRYD
jgi:hypothetical protein|tara:strand:- start:534 stop:896 length:363 start_codon:yes stop_codon:yes gene_type:complete